MATKKKKIQVTIELKTREELNQYLQPTYPKVVVIDGFHPFWGRCEVAEIMLKKFQEEPANANKVDWLSIPYEQIEDIVPKEKDESGKVILYNSIIKTSVKEFTECPAYADQDSTYKYQFFDNMSNLKRILTSREKSNSGTITSSSYESWNCSYSFTDGSNEYNAVVLQNKFGLIGYSFTKNNKAVSTNFKFNEE